MAELPEITKYAKQMHETLRGKEIESVELLQEKCSNVSAAELNRRLAGAGVAAVTHKGKWIFTRLTNDEHILLSFGMGADVLYFDQDKAPTKKYQVLLKFKDGSGYTARFWWFGHFYVVADKDLAAEPKTRDIAMDPFDKNFTEEYFTNLLKGKKTQIKSFLMNQKNVGGIGNMYMHDILFEARLHPQRKISDMDAESIKRLHVSILSVLGRSRDKGSFAYEMDFFGQKGNFGQADLIIGYKENQPCPLCATPITTLKTGSTSSYICPSCQQI